MRISSMLHCPRLHVARRWALAGLFAVALLAGGSLEAASPQFNRITPAGGQRGTEIELVLAGERIGDSPELLFYEPGLSVVSIQSTEPKVAKAKLAITPDCRLGLHALRLRTASGISNLRLFGVGALPEASEVEPNNDFSQPQKIALDSTINGVVLNEDVDYFLIEAKKGERITAEIEAVRHGYSINPPFFDPYLAILNTGRFELARSDDSPLLKQDGVVSILAPEDGTYIIQVRDSAYIGSDAFVYRLHVGRFPRPTTVLPGGGRPGETLEVHWLGDVAGEQVERVTLPTIAQSEFGLVAHDARGFAPSANPFRLVDFGNVLEVEPNDAVATGTVFKVPMACGGVISKPGDVDFFKFAATKGQVLDVRVFARQLGSPLDAQISIHRADGNAFASNDDSGGPDSYVRVTIPDDGEYLFAISDQLGEGGIDYAYRVEVTPVVPKLTVGLPERVQWVDTTLPVPQGNRVAALVSAQRVDFGGELQLNFNYLPTGVSVEAIPMAANRSDVPILLTAAEGTALTAGMVDLVGLRPDPNQPISGGFGQRSGLVRGQNQVEVWTYTTRRMPVAITQAVPFKIDIVEPKVPLVRGGSMNLKVVATRQGDFKAPIAIRMLYNPPGVGSSGSIVIPEGQNEALIPVTATGDAEILKWKIAVVAEATVGDGPVLVSSQLATLDVAEPYLAFTFQSAAVEQGQATDLVIAVEKKKDFPGAAKIELLGVPNEVTAEPREITQDATQLVFQVKTTDKSPPGRHKTVICRAVIMADGEPITHTLGTGELRIDAPLPPAAGAPAAPPPTPVAAAPAAPAEKRLTRLEKLRVERQQVSTKAAAPAPVPPAQP
jgi:Bacterial pre-peptidase C-terminal domain